MFDVEKEPRTVKRTFCGSSVGGLEKGLKQAVTFSLKKENLMLYNK